MEDRLVSIPGHLSLIKKNIDIMKTEKIYKIKNIDKKSTNYFWFIAVIIFATVIVYQNSLKNPFIWDQEVVILGNPLIKSFKNLPEVFKTNVEGRKLTSIGFYRPMEVISYMLDYSIWKFDSKGYHITSIIMHISNALLLFFLFNKIGIKIKIAFLICLIFAIHPINTETVTYSIRGDLLATFFSILCFICYLNVSNNKNLYAYLSIITYILALLSKEFSVVTPFIMLVFQMTHFYLFETINEKNHENTDRKQILKKSVFDLIKLRIFKNKLSKFTMVSLISISFMYVIVRLLTISSSDNKALSLISDATIYQRLFTFPRIVLTYLQLLIFPLNLHMEYLFVEKNLFSPYVWSGVPLILLLCYYFIKFIKSLSQTDKELKLYLFLFFSWFWIGLLPFYNIIVTLHATLTEHWAYFFGIGFIALAIIIGFHFYKKINNMIFKFFFYLILSAFISYYMFYTIKRNQEWSDEMSLYQHDLKYEPNSFILLNNVGVIYFRKGNVKAAKENFLKSIEVSPGRKYEIAHNNIGVIYENEGLLKEAEEAFNKSIKLNNYELAYGNLCRLYLIQNKVLEAISIGLKGRELYPNDLEINYYLGIGYYLGRNYRLSEQYFNYVQNIYPGYKDINKYLEIVKKN